MRKADEILILRRFSGYLRLHIPALIYNPKASLLLEKELSAFDGVRKVNVKKEMGKLSLHYDSILTLESSLLLLIDRIATALLRSDRQESYEKVMAEVEKARQRRLVRKAAVTVIMIYLIKIHWKYIARQWVQDPIRHWPKLATIGVLLYVHRKHIQGALSFE